MIDRSNAEEDLRVIRTLDGARHDLSRDLRPDRARGRVAVDPRYRCHSSCTTRSCTSRRLGPRQFASVWLVVLVLVLIANTFFVWREARKDGRLFVSPGMKLALRAIIPCLLIPARFTVGFSLPAFWARRNWTWSFVWIAFYGLALLSTATLRPAIARPARLGFLPLGFSRSRID